MQLLGEHQPRIVGCQRRTPASAPTGTRSSQTRFGSLLDQAALELGEGGKDVEYEFAGGACRVDHAVAHGSEGDAPVAQILHQGHEMPHGPTETVQLPNHQCVARLQTGQAAAEPWEIVLGTGELVREREFLRDALLGERVKLQAEILVVRADAGVTLVARYDRRVLSADDRTKENGERASIQTIKQPAKSQLPSCVLAIRRRLNRRCRTRLVHA